VEIAGKILSELNVKVVEEVTGGNLGMKILFDVQTGNVKVDYIQNIKF
jgi:chemotaxis receptor (MCP) glutamine deamidase CheD